MDNEVEKWPSRFVPSDGKGTELINYVLYKSVLRKELKNGYQTNLYKGLEQGLSEKIPNHIKKGD